jgi:hypothetical protein
MAVADTVSDPPQTGPVLERLGPPSSTDIDQHLDYAQPVQAKLLRSQINHAASGESRTGRGCSDL